MPPIRSLIHGIPDHDHGLGPGSAVAGKLSALKLGSAADAAKLTALTSVDTDAGKLTADAARLSDLTSGAADESGGGGGRVVTRTAARPSPSALCSRDPSRREPGAPETAAAAAPSELLHTRPNQITKYRRRNRGKKTRASETARALPAAHLGREPWTRRLPRFCCCRRERWEKEAARVMARERKGKHG